MRARMQETEWLTGEGAVRNLDGHTWEVNADIEPDGEVRDVFEYHKYFLVVHDAILSCRHQSVSKRWIHNLVLEVSVQISEDIFSRMHVQKRSSPI